MRKWPSTWTWKSLLHASKATFAQAALPEPHREEPLPTWLEVHFRARAPRAGGGEVDPTTKWVSTSLGWSTRVSSRTPLTRKIGMLIRFLRMRHRRYGRSDVGAGYQVVKFEYVGGR